MNVIDECLVCGAPFPRLLESVRGHDVERLYGSMGFAGQTLPDVFRFFVCNNCGLKWFDPTVTGSPSFYEAFQKHAWYYQAIKEEYYFAASKIPSHAKVLDVGCGAAHFANMIPNTAHFVGLEFNDLAVRQAKAKGIDVLKESIEALAKYSPGTYDVVVSFQVLEHVPLPALFLDACSKVLKNGGTLIISVPNEEGFLGQVLNNCLNLPPHHVTRWSKSTLEHWASSRGFEVESVFFDPVSRAHLKWWRHTQMLSRIRNRLGLPQVQVDLSATGRILSKFSAIAAQVWREDPGSAPGHSVTLAMKKQVSE